MIRVVGASLWRSLENGRGRLADALVYDQDDGAAVDDAEDRALVLLVLFQGGEKPSAAALGRQSPTAAVGRRRGTGAVEVFLVAVLVVVVLLLLDGATDPVSLILTRSIEPLTRSIVSLSLKCGHVAEVLVRVLVHDIAVCGFTADVASRRRKAMDLVPIYV